MGQGYSLTSLSAGNAGVDVPELSDLEFEKSLGNARFMKCIRARRKDGVAVAKIVMKPSSSIKWDVYVHELNVERKALLDIPNALGYHRIQQTSSAGYLVRQYIHSSLYDRMSTRPFLDPIEKKWLAFQLLCAVRDCHAKDVHHGDIKTENVLVTSWNWLFLTDFSSSYKPTYLPEDNPADFNFFFDTSSTAAGRRTCYLAPERFLRPGEDSAGKSKLNWAMDIFSVGCVIAELFMESPIFSLAQLFKYRSRDYDPSTHLDNIKDKDIREMIAHMIQLDPQDRYSAEEYLNFWKERAFPDYFYSFLHQYMYLITDPTSGRRPITAGQENLGEADDRIDRVYFDFDKVSFFLGFDSGQKTDHDSTKPASGSRANLFPLQIDIPNNRHQASALIHKPADNGSLLFLTLVEASVRSTARATARLRAIELMLAFAERVPDEVKLDRILPFLMELLNDDQTEAVKVSALRAITQLLELVHTLTAVNAYVFPEYILLRLNNHVLSPKKNPSAWLRATYASCLSSLANTASRFLDMMQALRSEGSLAGGNIQSEVGKLTGSSYQHHQNLYDSARNDLMAQFEAHTTALLTDTDTAVRRAFLGSISTLCVFFGSTRASDVILSHLNTYLNDRDWELKCAFFETIVGVATYVGGPSLEEFILPLMVQSLTDPEETVIERVLRSFSAIAGLGLFQRSTTWELVDIVARFTMHPNMWIREAAVEFIAAASKYLTVADCHGIITPLIRVYLNTLPSELSETILLDVMKKPMPRLVFDMALTWSVKTEKGVFWKAAQSQRTFTFGAGDHNISTISVQNLGPRALNRIPKNEEDEQWIQRLRNAGMEQEDEFKLVALREFIWRVAHRKSQVDGGLEPSRLNQIVKLSEINVTPQTVIFEKEVSRNQTKALRKTGNEQRHRTIAEALQDATSQASNAPAHQDGTRRSTQPTVVTTRSRSDASQDPDSQVQSPTGLDVPRPKGGLSPLSGPTVASSIDSKASFRLTDHNHGISRRGSALSLMGRVEPGKATAELGTTQENAVGQVAIGVANRETKRSSTVGQIRDNQQRHLQEETQQTAHDYSGNDPSVLRLLNSLYLDNYPVDYLDFGPMVNPKRKEPIKRAGGQPVSGAWRPEGNLVAFLGEHTAPVNRVVVAPDHNFFITGSDDGTVKVWDTSRLERNTTHRSRHTHKHAIGNKITSITFIENTHCFVSTGSDGSIHIVRVDFTQKYDESSQSSPRYGKLKVVREYNLPNGEHAVWCEHFKEESRSVLILATNKCRIIALELRTMTELYVLSNPLHHGTPLCFCVDRRHHWLLVGTSHGILDLWDLRFRLRLKAWGFSAGSPIHRISLIPSKSTRQHKVAIAGGTGQGEVTVWDIEKALCTNVYRTGLSKENSKGYRLIENDEERSGGMLGRFATSSEPSSNAGMDRGVRAIAMGLRILEGNEPRHYFFVSAGPDWKVRFWDSNREASSLAVVVSGMELEEGRPSYAVSQPSHDLTIVSETLSPPPPISGSSSGSTPAASPARGAAAGSTAKKSGRDKARSSIISMQQQHLLKSHLDTVMDVALLEYPYGMVVSVDRAGLIYVFS